MLTQWGKLVRYYMCHKGRCSSTTSLLLYLLVLLMVQKSCTSWGWKFIPLFTRFYVPGGCLGFLPSTVVLHSFYYLSHYCYSCCCCWWPLPLLHRNRTCWSCWCKSLASAYVPSKRWTQITARLRWSAVPFFCQANIREIFGPQCSKPRRPSSLVEATWQRWAITELGNWLSNRKLESYIESCRMTTIVSTLSFRWVRFFCGANWEVGAFLWTRTEVW